MIKSKFIRYKLKKGKWKRHHVTFKESKNIGIIYDYNVFQEYLPMIEKELKKEKKSVTLLTMLSAFEAIKNLDVFIPGDIASFGKIKNETVRKFINKPFDYLIVLLTGNDLDIQYVASLCNSGCRVGIENDTKIMHFELEIKSSEDLQSTLHEMVKYLKMI